MAWTNPTTFNGVPIVPMPNAKLRSIDLTMNDSVSTSISPWTRARQTYDWMADWWEAEISLPTMKIDTVGAWLGWLAALRGQVNYFWLGHPLATAPQGVGTGTPLVKGGFQTGRTLVTDGWTPNKTGIMLPGDYFQVGVRLHMVTTTANSDASGNATFNIWPRLREKPLDNDPINVSSPQGLFALVDNARKYSSNEMKTFGISLKCVEAL